jgi:hypothetical protein
LLGIVLGAEDMVRSKNKIRPTPKKLLWFTLVLILITLSVFIYRVFSIPLVQVKINNKGNHSEGYVLFAPIVDDLGEPLSKANRIYLTDLNGRIVHTWNVLGAVQYVDLEPDGHLLYSTRDRSFEERAGVRELDAFGNVLWYYLCRADHDFVRLDNGNILIHCIDDKEAPAIGPGLVRCPEIIEVTLQKEIVWEWRGEEHWRELTELAGIRFPLPSKGGQVLDWAHNNSCHVIRENKLGEIDPRFRPGNIVISYPNLDTVAVIDRSTGQIVWAWGPGMLDGQHAPSMMENGHLLIFDNGTKRGYSRIIEVDPLSREIAWEYKDTDSPRLSFFSKYMSGVQKLSNGNYFVCLSGFIPKSLVQRARRVFSQRLRGENSFLSRLLEITRDREIVWDCRIEGSGRNMHSLYRASQYDSQYVAPLLEKVKRLHDIDKERLKSLPYTR